MTALGGGGLHAKCFSDNASFKEGLLVFFPYKEIEMTELQFEQMPVSLMSFSDFLSSTAVPGSLARI